MAQFLKKQIHEDIINCKKILEINDNVTMEEQVGVIISVYSIYIKNLSEGVTLYWYGDVDILADIKLLIRKLELFEAEQRDGVDSSAKNQHSVVYNNNNANTNTNTNTINFESLFNETRDTIEKDESLSESDIKEILERISDIENIYKSNEPKNKKWFKLRPLMGWIGDRGIGVATSILNLVTAIIKSS